MKKNKKEKTISIKREHEASSIPRLGYLYQINIRHQVVSKAKSMHAGPN